MTASLTVSNQYAFADGNAGHSIALGSAPNVGDVDLLYVNSNTVVTTPSGFAIATNNVGSQGAYIYYRIAVGGESSSVTITTSGDHNTAVTHERWSGLTALDTHTVTAVDGVLGTSTPSNSTGTMAATGELAVAFAALHSLSGGGQNTPVWASSFVATFTSPATIGTLTTGVANWTASKTGVGTGAESTSVSWSGNQADDRYTLTASFTVAATVSGPASTIAARRRPWTKLRRARLLLPVRDQVNPPVPFVITDQPRRIRGLYLRRGRVIGTVRAQVNPPPPIPAVHPTRELRGLYLRRGHLFGVVRDQVNPPLPLPVQHPTRQLRGVYLRRGRVVRTVPDQVTLPVPATPVPVQHPTRQLRGCLLRRGRTTTPVRDQVNPPVAPAVIDQSRKIRPGYVRRGRPLFPLAAADQSTPPPGPRRDRPVLPILHRGRVVSAVPAPVVLIAPAFVAPAIHVRLRPALLVRHARVVPAPILAGAAPVTSVPGRMATTAVTAGMATTAVTAALTTTVATGSMSSTVQP